MLPDSLKKAIESFKFLPGVGEKTAERYVFSLLQMEEEQIRMMSDSILEVKEKIHKCSICNTLTDSDTCFVCSDKTRNRNLLCVVDDSKNVFLLEKNGAYNGLYHVLDGLISPLDGVNPEDIGLDGLIDRITAGEFSEVILAFKPSVEGETTALYIKRILADLPISVTKLASGLPMGVDMEYVDSLTLERALKERKVIE